jgi:hypothetical protein
MTKEKIIEIITDSINSSNRLQGFIDETRRKLFNKEDKEEFVILKSIISEIEKNITNQQLLNLLTDFIQLQNNKDCLDFTELKMVETLLLENIKFQEYDISYYEDLIFYYWNVMDDKDKTKFYLHEAINKFNKKINIFKKLLKEIESEENLK